MPLTSLMDIFTILVFFLLTNSGASEVLEPPKSITLPASVVETKPRETVVVIVSETDILIQGRKVADTQEVLKTKSVIIVEIKNELLRQRQNILGISTRNVAETPEVTLLVHKAIPFKLLKKIMSSCTSAGYGKISLAVIQKGSQS